MIGLDKTLDDRLDMAKRLILNDEGLALRDETMAKLRKSLQDSDRHLWEVIFRPEKLARETVVKIKSNESVSSDSLLKFFRALESELRIELGFDENKHTTAAPKLRQKLLKSELSPVIEPKGDGITSLLIRVCKLPTEEMYRVESAIARTDCHCGIEPWVPTKLPLAWENQTAATLSDCLREILDHVGENVALTDLTVEWFLPFELMSATIDDCKIGRIPRCYSSLCKSIHIRSTDRFEPIYKPFLGGAKQRWHRLNKDPEAFCDRDFAHLSNFNRDQSASLIGGWFVESVESEDIANYEVFWDEVLVKGLPIALWMRQAVDVEAAHGAMTEFIADLPVAQLPEKLTNARRTVLGSTASNTIREYSGVRQFALMWDNPFRPFPEIDYHSK